MPDPLIKWAKRNTHSNPPLFPWGLKRLTRPLPSLLPPTRKGGKKYLSSRTRPRFSTFYQRKCQASYPFHSCVFLFLATLMKSFGTQNMDLCLKCLPPPR